MMESIIAASNKTIYLIEDEAAPFFAKQWAGKDVDDLIGNILANKELWSPF